MILLCQLVDEVSMLAAKMLGRIFSLCREFLTNMRSSNISKVIPLIRQIFAGACRRPRPVAFCSTSGSRSRNILLLHAINTSCFASTIAHKAREELAHAIPDGLQGLIPPLHVQAPAPPGGDDSRCVFTHGLLSVTL